MLQNSGISGKALGVFFDKSLSIKDFIMSAETGDYTISCGSISSSDLNICSGFDHENTDKEDDVWNLNSYVIIPAALTNAEFNFYFPVTMKSKDIFKSIVLAEINYINGIPIATKAFRAWGPNFGKKLSFKDTYLKLVDQNYPNLIDNSKNYFHKAECKNNQNMKIVDIITSLKPKATVNNIQISAYLNATCSQSLTYTNDKSNYGAHFIVSSTANLFENSIFTWPSANCYKLNLIYKKTIKNYLIICPNDKVQSGITEDPTKTATMKLIVSTLKFPFDWGKNFGINNAISYSWSSSNGILAAYIVERESSDDQSSNKCSYKPLTTFNKKIIKTKLSTEFSLSNVYPSGIYWIFLKTSKYPSTEITNIFPDCISSILNFKKCKINVDGNNVIIELDTGINSFAGTVKIIFFVDSLAVDTTEQSTYSIEIRVKTIDGIIIEECDNNGKPQNFKGSGIVSANENISLKPPVIQKIYGIADKFEMNFVIGNSRFFLENTKIEFNTGWLINSVRSEFR